MKKFLCQGLLLLMVMASCSKKVPDSFTPEKRFTKIYPDYNEVTVPYNIAPLNFKIKEDADDYITKIYASHGEPIVINGKDVEIDIKDWKKLLDKNKGGTIMADAYVKKADRWYKFFPIKIKVAPEPIDEYISYRLIEPSYVTYEVISINQRNITNFDEREIYNNFKISSGENGQCINCHSYQNYHTSNMQMHVRQRMGGTVIVSDGNPEKVNLKTKQLISGGVYPSWHPTEKLIAYSINSIGQDFHTKSPEKVEVTDTKSDLILYDIKKNEVSYIVNDKNSLETWPSWSPDGKMLYFVSARYKADEKNEDAEVALKYQSIKYDILRIPFDIKTHKFGKQDTVFKASAVGKSATFPRISPDGNYMIFTLGSYGNFHIWHKSADLYLMDMRNGKVRPMTELNSPDVESYHSWSSNGRWIIFSSRREDGSYTRFYISYFDKNGKAGKPFILPQKNPNFYKQFFKSFNIPEFMVEPVKLSPQDFLKVIEKKPKDAKFVEPKM